MTVLPEREVPVRYPIRGTFFDCCASAGVESASTISTMRNRSGIGPSDKKVRGFKHCYSETPALVSSSKELLRRGAARVLIIFLWTTDGGRGRLYVKVAVRLSSLRYNPGRSSNTSEKNLAHTAA